MFYALLTVFYLEDVVGRRLEQRVVGILGEYLLGSQYLTAVNSK